MLNPFTPMVSELCCSSEIQEASLAEGEATEIAEG